jgi:hypothetical protein
MSLETINAQLTELLKLKDGWLDGWGFAPSRAAVETAREYLPRVEDILEARVYIYPTPEGGVQAEWSTKSWSFDLCFLSETARLSGSNLEDRSDIELNSPSRDLRWILDTIETLTAGDKIEDLG